MEGLIFHSQEYEVLEKVIVVNGKYFRNVDIKR